MSRPLRVEYPGAVYHVTSRGNAQQSIYLDEPDRQTFLRILTQVLEGFHWLCHAYCLMGNHYHLLVDLSAMDTTRPLRETICGARSTSAPRGFVSAWCGTSR